MLNKLLKSSLILVLAISLTACAGGKKKTPGEDSGSVGELIPNLGGDYANDTKDLTVTSAKELEASVKFAYYSVSDKEEFAPELSYQDIAEYNKGFNVDIYLKGANGKDSIIYYYPDSTNPDYVAEKKVRAVMNHYTEDGTKVAWASYSTISGGGTNKIDDDPKYTVENLSGKKLITIILYTKADGTKTYTVLPSMTFNVVK